jgi:transposase
MKEVSIVGLDLAKRVFQVHGVDAQGRVTVQKRLTRSELPVWFSRLQPCLVGMEACATAHYWAREIAKLGHQVRLIPPAYVKPYVRRQKNDRADAAAICEAVSRPSMRFAAVKTIEQQAVQMLHRSRELLVRQYLQLNNALRAHLAEIGLIFPQGKLGTAKAIATVQEADADIPAFIRQVLCSLAEQMQKLHKEVAILDKQMTVWHRADADSQRLTTIPGVGIITASAIIAAIGDGSQFRSGREFAAWIGLVPRQHSSGGKEKLGSISKKGNVYLRQLLVLGATGHLLGKRSEKAPGGKWFNELLRRKPRRVAAVALANKMARIVWAVLTKGESYRLPLIGDGSTTHIIAAA